MAERRVEKVKAAVRRDREQDIWKVREEQGRAARAGESQRAAMGFGEGERAEKSAARQRQSETS